MKHISILVGLMIFLGAGCTTTNQPEQKIQLSIEQTKCEQSGGLYANNACTCQGNKYGDASGYSYKDETGYCEGADGTPGGQLGEEFRKNLEQLMK